MIDLTDVDLADVVTIEHGGVEVYDETRHRPYPRVGQKLNRPARIVLNQIEKPDDMTIIQFIQALEDNATDQDVSFIFPHSFKQGHHLLYDQAKQEWIFEVKHFTKYKLDIKKKPAETIPPQQPPIP